MLRQRQSVLLARSTQDNVQVDWNGGWRTIQSARRKAILAYRGQNVMIHHRAKRLENLQVRRLAGRIDRHLDNGFSFKSETRRDPIGIRFDRDRVNQFWCSNPSRDANRGRGMSNSLGIIEFLGLNEFGLSVVAAGEGWVCAGEFA